MMTDFLNRPKHFNSMSLESIYSKLFYIAKDHKPFTNEELLKYAEKSVSEKRSIGASFYPLLVDALIERNLLTEAENYAEKGEKATEEDLKTRYDWTKDEIVRENLEKGFRNEMLGAHCEAYRPADQLPRPLARIHGAERHHDRRGR